MLRAIGATIPKFGPSRLVCVHWRNFPPVAAVLAVTKQKTIAQLRAENVIDSAEFQRWQVWERICGLPAMRKQKCRYCPHARRLAPPDHTGQQMLTKLDGSCPTPILDLPTIENLSRRRGHRTAGHQPPAKRR